MNEILVSVENLSKKFCKDRYLSMKYGLLDIIRNIAYSRKLPTSLRKKEFFALQDITFSVRRGECLGVLGSNGAGKTTLLKLILMALLPDDGRVTTTGQMAGILNIAAGLHMDLTGKENIYFCCSLYKKSRSETELIFDDIVETAELGEFIFDQLKTYSSGMIARLIFAISMHIGADILILDDVLYVGDLKFIEKSEFILNKLMANTALIFASHNVDTLLAHANKILVLDNGKAKFLGESAKAISYYYSMLEDNSVKGISVGGGSVDIYGIEFKSTKSGSFNNCNYGDSVNISFKIRPQRIIKRYHMIIAIITNKNMPIIKSEVVDKFARLEAKIEKSINIFIDKIQLVPGKYYISIKFYELESKELLAAIKNAVSFNVENGPVGISPLNIEYKWELI